MKAHGSPIAKAAQWVTGLLPDSVAQPLMERAGVDRLTALHTGTPRRHGLRVGRGRRGGQPHAAGGRPQGLCDVPGQGGRHGQDPAPSLTRLPRHESGARLPQRSVDK